MRIQKYIAECGVCSRRAAEDLVREGKVTVNNKPATIGMEIDPENDSVRCYGKRIYIKATEKQYFMFYKPRGVITAMVRQDDRSIVADLIKGIKGRVFPVGRLDRDSEGMLLLTDDGELALRLTHPKYRIDKTYRVTIAGDVPIKSLDKIREGVEIEEGITTRPAEVFIKMKKEDKTVLHITISEGKNRQIRRMCEVLGLEILLLKRIAVAGVMLGHLSPAEYRPLTKKEKTKLFEAVNLKVPEPKVTSTKTSEMFKNSRGFSRGKSERSTHEKRFLKQFKDK